jgi:hypothetical protein
MPATTARQRQQHASDNSTPATTARQRQQHASDNSTPATTARQGQQHASNNSTNENSTRSEQCGGVFVPLLLLPICSAFDEMIECATSKGKLEVGDASTNFFYLSDSDSDYSERFKSYGNRTGLKQYIMIILE